MDYVRQIDSKLVLIGGEELARFMCDHNVGVVPGQSFVIKNLNHEYFAEE
jgi:restriction system protein